jgi:hypothetical protein
MDQIKRAYLVENRYFVKPAQNGELSATGQIRTEYSELMDRLLADPKEKGAADDSVPPLRNVSTALRHFFDRFITPTHPAPAPTRARISYGKLGPSHGKPQTARLSTGPAPLPTGNSASLGLRLENRKERGFPQGLEPSWISIMQLIPFLFLPQAC